MLGSHTITFGLHMDPLSGMNYVFLQTMVLLDTHTAEKHGFSILDIGPPQL